MPCMPCIFHSNILLYRRLIVGSNQVQLLPKNFPGSATDMYYARTISSRPITILSRVLMLFTFTCLFSFHRGRYTLAEVIDKLQEDESGGDVVLGFPEENSSIETDEDSDDNDIPTGDPYHFSRNLLTADAFVDGEADEEEQESPEDSTHGKAKDNEGPQCKRSKWSKPGNDGKWRKEELKPSFLKPEPYLRISEDDEQELSNLSEPIDFFMLLLGTEMLDLLCEESNLYANCKGVALNLTYDDLMKFLGIFVLIWLQQSSIPKALLEHQQRHTE